jgi:hypothetical protein
MWGAILINIGGDIDEGDFAVGRFDYIRIINYKLIYNNNNSFNSLCPIMKSLELPGNNKTR